MEPAQTPVIEKIRTLVTKLEGGATLSDKEYSDMLRTFERYECWSPYFRLIQRRLGNPERRKLEDFVELARVQNIYLEDIFAAAETFSNMVTQQQLTYAKVRDEIIPQIVEPEDFTSEATLLHAVWAQFPDVADQVLCLERLCMLYEKKTHNEAQLALTYDTLRDVDSHNVKALRYFKMVHTQNNEWELVVKTLMTLIQSVKHPQELFRVAQELSAIFLYQLDLAQEAIDVIERHCSDSPLDTSTILYDAYHRLGNWDGCLRVLRQTLLSVEEDAERAVLHHKIAQISEQLDDYESSFENYKKAAELWPSFLDPIEGLMTIAIAKKDWETVREWLHSLCERIHDEELDTQLKQAIQRLDDGLSHAKSE